MVLPQFRLQRAMGLLLLLYWRLFVHWATGGISARLRLARQGARGTSRGSEGNQQGLGTWLLLALFGATFGL